MPVSEADRNGATSNEQSRLVAWPRCCSCDDAAAEDASVADIEIASEVVPPPVAPERAPSMQKVLTDEKLLERRIAHFHLTKEQIMECTRVFAEFDLDGNNAITTDELGTVLKRLGQNPTDEEVKACLSKHDLDGNGVLDLGEFIEVLSAAARLHPASFPSTTTYQNFAPLPLIFLLPDLK